MKSLLSILLALVLGNSLQGQVFNRLYDDTTNLVSTLNIQKINDDSLFILPANFNGRLGFKFLGMDINGIIHTDKLYRFDTIAVATGGSNSTNETFDGGFIMGGGLNFDTVYLGYLAKFNVHGDTLWTKSYGDSINFYTFKQAIQTSDGGYAAVGQYGAVGQRSDGLLIKTDSAGNLEWQQTYSTTLGTLEALNSIKETYDGGFILGGDEREFPNQTTRNYDPILIKTDSLGNQQWRYRLNTLHDDIFAYVIQTFDSNYVFASSNSYLGGRRPDGKAILVKVDQNGNLMWMKEYGQINTYNRLFCVKQLQDSSLIATGTYLNEGLIVHADKNGDSIFVETYTHQIIGPNNFHYLYDIEALDDGGYMAAGEFRGGTPHRQDAWVIRVDSNGCNLSSCLVALEAIAKEEVKFSIYPNPSNGILNIESNQNISEIILFNMNGRAVKREKSSFKQIELPSEKGLYLIQIRTTDGEINNFKVFKI